MQSVDNKIDNFISYFRAQLKIICELDSSLHTYKSILCMSLLDAIFKSIYPEETHKAKFIGGMEKFSSWEESDRVSIFHIMEVLKIETDPIFKTLKRYLEDKIFDFEEQLRSSLSCTLIADVDPPWGDIEPFLPEILSDNPKIVKSIESCQHKFLFYECRNILIHELRRPGRPIEEMVEGEPAYYITFYTSGSNGFEYQLVYPTKWLEAKCDKIISNIENYLRTNNIDPYLSYKFGEYWIPALNK